MYKYKAWEHQPALLSSIGFPASLARSGCLPGPSRGLFGILRGSVALSQRSLEVLGIHFDAFGVHVCSFLFGVLFVGLFLHQFGTLRGT